MLFHATCVSLSQQGILLLGPSASGKSDFALRLIDHGAQLVADDQVEIRHEHGQLIASPPARLRGLLEVRGIGVVPLPYLAAVPLVCAIQLVPRAAVVRLPEPQFWDCQDVRLPLWSLHAFDASTLAKIRLLLHASE